MFINDWTGLLKCKSRRDKASCILGPRKRKNRCDKLKTKSLPIEITNHWVWIWLSLMREKWYSPWDKPRKNKENTDELYLWEVVANIQSRTMRIARRSRNFGNWPPSVVGSVHCSINQQSHYWSRNGGGATTRYLTNRYWKEYDKNDASAFSPFISAFFAIPASFS